MGVVKMYIEKFDAEVTIDEDHPLAVAQRAKGEPVASQRGPASEAEASESASAEEPSKPKRRRRE